TIVCDTFAFLPYQGAGNFLGYFSERNGQGTQYNPGDGLKRNPGMLKIYVRAGAGTCVSEDSFNITFRTAPDIASISAFDVCDTISLPGIAGDRLSGNEAYYTLPDGQGTRLLPGALIDTSTTLFVYDRIGSCVEELLFTVLVIPQPKLDPIADQIACDTFTLPPITGEDLSGAEIYSSGIAGTGVQFSPGDVLTTDQKVYIYDERARCNSQDSFNITFNYRPQITGPIGNRLVCDSLMLPTITGVDLLGNEVFTTAPLGLGDTILPGTTFSDSTTIFLTAGNAGCLDTQRLQLFIDPQPSFAPVPDTMVCDFYILPIISGNNLTTNVAYFDTPGGFGNQFLPGDTLRTSGTYYLFDETGVGCIAEDSFEISIGLTPQLALVNDTLACGQYTLPIISGTQLNNPIYSDTSLGGGTIYSPGDIITDSLRLFLYDEDMGCFDSTSFTVRVLPQVTLDIPFTDTTVCDTFVLEALTGSNLTGAEGYFTEPFGAGNRIDPGTILRDSIVLYAFDGRETCIDSATITINIQPTPQLDPLVDILSCDAYVLPVLTGQNLTAQAAYFDLNSGARFLAGDTILVNRTLEARDTNSFGCGTAQLMEVRITSTPQLANLDDVEVCDSLVLAPIQGQFLPTGTAYYTAANGGGQLIPFGTAITSSQDIFVYSDTLGCTVDTSFAVTVNYTPNVTNALSDSSACFSLEVPIISGTNLTLNTAYYTEPNGSGAIVNLPLELFQDTALYLFGNDGSCVLSDTIEIQVNSIQANVLVTDSIECSGDLGSIQLTNLNVEVPFTISWNDTAFIGLTELNNVPAGNYDLLITDVNGCEFNQSIQLLEVDPIILDCSILQQNTVPNGSDGGIQLQFSGGTGPFTIFVTGAQVDTLTFDGGGFTRLRDLPAGIYDFNVVDGRGCNQTCSLEITAPPCLLDANLTSTDVTCNGFQDGTLNLDITGFQDPLNIDWSVDSLDGRTSISNVSGGTYSVTVTDANGCIDSSSTVVFEPEPLTILVLEEQPVSNNSAGDGIASIRFGGGQGPYTLIWDGPETDSLTFPDTASVLVDSLVQGVYIFGIIDSSGCRISATVTITNPNCGMTVSFLKQDQTCPNTTDGELTTIVTGGVGPYEFIWSDGSRDSIRTDLSVGIYNLQVFDSETCTSEGIDTIGITNPLPSVSLLSSSVQCDSSCQEI
ncbi:MAG: hypothetical protein AAF705_08005, partial [Bacteroidota bacterium]